jgi:peroxiredoxin
MEPKEGVEESSKTSGASPERSDPGGASARESTLAKIGFAALALLLYAGVAAAAVETFLAESSLRWVTVGTAGAYAVITALIWRWTRWAVRAALSFLVLVALLAFAAWSTQGADPGIVLAQQPTSVLLSVFTAVAIALGGVLLTVRRGLPVVVRIVAGLLAAYGIAAFALGVAQGTAYAQLLRGESFGPPAPYALLQGAVVGALLVIPLAVLWELFRGAARVRGRALRGWALQLVTLATCGGVAAWTLFQPGVSGVPATPEVAAAPPAASAPAPSPPPVAAAPPAQPAAPAPVAAAPALDFEPITGFTLPSARDDSLVSLSDYRGKVVLINWWQSSCSHSVRESPRLVELYQKYRDQGLEIIGVSTDSADSVGGIPAYLESNGITWPVALHDLGEFKREIRHLGSGNTPENYLVSRRGELEYIGTDTGAEDFEKLEAAVREALAESETEPGIQPRELRAAPPFSLPDLDGSTRTLDEFVGKPLLVHFFTENSCGWVGALLSKLHQEYSGRGLQMVGISLTPNEAGVQECVETHQMQYPILRSGHGQLQLDWIGAHKGWAIFFVTKDGKILKKIIHSAPDGIDETVFRRYAEILVRS